MRHHLNTFSATFLVVASMLGTGILTTSGIMLSLVKTPGAVLCIWVAGGLLAWIGAWCYGELARRMPRNGGEASILRELFSPSLGELAGWTSFVVAFAAGNAASSLALSDYLAQALPGLALAPQVVACTALLLVTSLHGLFGPLGLRIQTLLAASKFILLAGLTLYGIFLASPAMEAPVSALEPLRRTAEFGAPWGLAMMLVMFAYSGWNAAIYVAGEVEDPVRNVRRAMIMGTSIVMLLYVAINAVLLTSLPAQELEGIVPVIAVLVKHLFGAQAASLFSGLVAFALLSSLGVSAFLGPRVLATMLGWYDKAGDDDSARSLVRPSLVWLQAGLSIFMVLTGSFVQILTVMGFLLGLFPILCVLGLYRVREHDGHPQRLLRYVLAPVFVGVSTVVLLLGAAQSPHEVGIAVALIGFFFLARVGIRRCAWI
ncbi:APC family permease [Accumulibacter sp.]|uniref:APC family permease n=1 Tax=Accumulibacter sp. TaxID=2053492 RepID=UPI002636F612|nr:amino acid permease [Accumulibacter sp.]